MATPGEIEAVVQNITDRLHDRLVKTLQDELNHVEDTAGFQFMKDSYIFIFVVVVLATLAACGFLGWRASRLVRRRGDYKPVADRVVGASAVLPGMQA